MSMTSQQVRSLSPGDTVHMLTPVDALAKVAYVHISVIPTVALEWAGGIVSHHRMDDREHWSRCSLVPPEPKSDSGRSAMVVWVLGSAVGCACDQRAGVVDVSDRKVRVRLCGVLELHTVSPFDIRGVELASDPMDGSLSILFQPSICKWMC